MLEISIAPKGGADENEGEYEDHELEEACEKLLAAEEVKADEKLMAALKPYMDKKKQALEKVSGMDLIKKKAEKRIKEIDTESETLKRKRGE